MAKRYLIVFGLTLFLVLYHQTFNHYIEPNPQDIQSEIQGGLSPSPFRLAKHSPAAASGLYILNARNTVTLVDKKLREKHPYFYRVDLKTGTIESLDYLEQVIDENPRCLGYQSFNELKMILSSATVCESPEIEESSTNIHCNMSYTLPYALLAFSEGVRYSLGEKNTACDYPTMLCGSDNEKLIHWIKATLGTLKNLKCQQ